MPTNDKIIQNFTQEILKLQEQNKQKLFTTEQLKQVALSIGVSDEEWLEMLKTADNKVIIAENHLKLNNFFDALSEANTALSINPNHTQAYIVAAKAASALYIKEQEQLYKEQTQYFANELLRRNPNNSTALQILSDIQTIDNQRKSKTKTYFIYSAIALFAVGLILLLFFLFKSNGNKPNEQTRNELIVAQENALSQWAQLQNVIKRRDMLLPQLMAVVNVNDQQTKQQLQVIEQLQEKIKTASDNEKIKLQFDLQKQFEELTKQIALNSNNEQIKLVLVQIEGTYNRISVEAKRYNDLVRNYNILVKKHATSFPEFKEMMYFQ